MTPAVKRLVSQAIVRYLDGNFEQFRAWVDAAAEEYKREADRNRMHATIGEILESKDVSTWSKLQAIGQ